MLNIHKMFYKSSINNDPFIVQLLPILEYDGERCKLYSHIKGYISYFIHLI